MRREQDTKCPTSNRFLTFFFDKQRERTREREREREAGIANTAVLSASGSGRNEGRSGRILQPNMARCHNKKRHLDADRNHRPLDYVWRIWCFQHRETTSNTRRRRDAEVCSPKTKNTIYIYSHMWSEDGTIAKKNQSVNIFQKEGGSSTGRIPSLCLVFLMKKNHSLLQSLQPRFTPNKSLPRIAFFNQEIPGRDGRHLTN